MRRTIPLGGAWRFMPDLRDAGLARGWHEPGAPDRDWMKVPVGRPWDTYGEAFRGYENVAWFRRSFRWNGPRPRVARIEFAGAGHRCEVWLNGRRAGSHECAYVPFALDVRGALRRGANTLAIRIRHVFDSGTAPIRNTDWWKFGGIIRPVALVASGDPIIDRATVTTGGDPGAPLVEARARIAAIRPGLVLTAELRGRSRRVTRSVPVVPPGDARIPLSGRGFPLWSPDRPVLVDVVLTLRDSRGAVLDRVIRRTGIRVLGWDRGVLRLNGNPVFLRGVNQVEEYPGWTCSPSLAVMRARVRDLKRNLRANFFRTAHYPHHPAFLDLCDEEGLLTCGEIPYCYQPERSGTTARGREMLDELFWRDAHRPSVIWWSTGNERPVEKPAVASGVVRLIRHAKGLDSSRPITCVSNRGLSDRSLPAHDLLALNMYVGVWGGTTPTTLEGLRRSATRELARDLAAVRRRFPEKPLVITEFGAPAFPIPGGVFAGSRWQAEYLRIHMAVFSRTKWLSGCVAWCYADQRVGSYGHYPVGYLGTPQLEVFGLKTLDGAPKPAWRVVARAFGRLARR